MEKGKKDNIEITEMFMCQADHERCFYGIIKRYKDDQGNSSVFSRIIMPDGLICSTAPEQKELGRNLDEMCIMVLDHGLHNKNGKYVEILGNRCFLN